MAELLSPQYKWLWAAALALLLFLPVRHFIWVMSVRRAERRHGPADDAARMALKRRATVTSALLCAVFAPVYVGVLFGRMFGQP